MRFSSVTTLGGMSSVRAAGLRPLLIAPAAPGEAAFGGVPVVHRSSDVLKHVAPADQQARNCLASRQPKDLCATLERCCERTVYQAPLLVCIEAFSSHHRWVTFCN